MLSVLSLGVAPLVERADAPVLQLIRQVLASVARGGREPRTGERLQIPGGVPGAGGVDEPRLAPLDTADAPGDRRAAFQYRALGPDAGGRPGDRQPGHPHPRRLDAEVAAAAIAVDVHPLATQLR